MKRGSEPVLLDVNVLIALGWIGHPQHVSVRSRMAAQTGPWLTCALTQLGFVRLLANSAVVNQVVSPMRAAELLTAMTADPMHIYLSGSPALDGQMFQRAMGHNQVTDVYLLHLAAGNQARFLTLDRRLDKLAAGICGLEVLQ